MTYGGQSLSDLYRMSLLERAIIGAAFLPIIVLAQEPSRVLELPVNNRTSDLIADQVAIQAVPAGESCISYIVSNQGSKTVLGYGITAGTSTAYQEFLPPVHPGLTSGSADRERRLVVAGASPQQLRQQTFSISAVIFSDGTAEGDPDAIKDLITLRQGRLLAHDRMQPVLNSLSVTIQTAGVRAITDAVSGIRNLPESNDAGMPASGRLLSGMRDSYGELIYELQSILDNHLSADMQRLAVSRILARQQATQTQIQKYLELARK